jgi:hypothetical protein
MMLSRNSVVRVIGPDVDDRDLEGMTGRIEDVVGDLARVALTCWGGAGVTFPLSCLMDDALYVHHGVKAPMQLRTPKTPATPFPVPRMTPSALHGDSEPLQRVVASQPVARWNAFMPGIKR